MNAEEGLRNKLSQLASTDEWKEVKEAFFDKEIRKLLTLNSQIEILPEDSKLKLDYKDLLLARQVAGEYLIKMLKKIEIYHSNYPKVSK